MTEPSLLRWGIIGPGRIAAEFARALQFVENSQLQAVSGRSKSKVEAFARTHGVAQCYDSHYALLHNPDVDVIYIATPHRYHYELARECLLAGKPVLCEKPLTVNAAQAQSLIELSRQQGVFLMEALWTRFLPIYEDIRQWLASGEIGREQSISSSFGFEFPRDPHGRLLNRELAGGALLDLGVYNLAMTQWVLGVQPDSHVIDGFIGETGVDEHDEVTLFYADGCTSTFSISLTQQLSNDFVIQGERGCIRIHPMFWSATRATLLVNDSEQSTTLSRGFRATGLEYEIEAVARCIRGRLIECPQMPHKATLETIQLMDQLRRDMGLRYSF
ncbi:MAG: dihydrodiol dehydrogenase / D-xylose 1-dehydrogenase (NADP) [Halioglobus sp.]|jgi:dihydrodiol dehydrogenase / D-xylose 1-dehydrogenase (NADP)